MRRSSHEDSPPLKVNPYDPNTVLDPHMATRAAVDKVMGLGIRKHIYQEVGSPMASNIVGREAETVERSPEPDVSFHMPVDTPQNTVEAKGESRWRQTKERREA